MVPSGLVLGGEGEGGSYGYGVSFGGDVNVLKLDSGNGHTSL